MSLEIQRFRKEVICPYSGQKFSIRRVWLRDCLLELGALPSVLLEPVAKQLEVFKEKVGDQSDQAAQQKLVKFYLTKGVVEPKVWFGDGEQPADTVASDDLAGDTDYLVGQITQFSFDLAGLREFEEFFRRSVAEPSGHDGQAVRPEAIEPNSAAGQ